MPTAVATAVVWTQESAFIRLSLSLSFMMEISVAEQWHQTAGGVTPLALTRWPLTYISAMDVSRIPISSANKV